MVITKLTIFPDEKTFTLKSSILTDLITIFLLKNKKIKMSQNCETKTCNRCKKSYQLKDFIGENGKSLVTCSKCREKGRNQRKNKPQKIKEIGQSNVCEVCGKSALFNFKGETCGRFCKEHKEKDMIDIHHQTCQHDKCNKRPSYNYKEQKIGIFCNKHKKIGMINVLTPICLHESCLKIPAFNYKGQKKGLYCFEHKLKNMVNIKSDVCKYKGCNTISVYNYKGQKKGLYCFEHKFDKMINIKDKPCLFEGCDNYPIFNVNGKTKGIYCFEHKKDDMIDVCNRKCAFEGCITRPSFNFKDQKRALYCFEHKKKDMVNVIDHKCLFEGCEIRPNYNFKGEKIGLYCVSHKEKNMIDITHPICNFKDCCIRPNYNFKGQKKGLYCFTHKLDGMVDVTHPICNFEDCCIRPSYGFCGQSATRCSEHKLKNMFVKPKRNCIIKDCKELAAFGQKEPSHCESHQLENEICLLTKKCCKCGEIDILNKNGLCITTCNPIQEFEKQKIWEKTKEMQMIKYLDTHINDKEHDFKIVDDKIIDSSCNLYRPDRRYDCGTHQIIIECDEHQHKNKQYCEKYRSLKHFEECRMYEIQQACGMNCIFIRWNPDTFRLNGKTSHTFTQEKRLETLVKWIKYCINLQIDKESPPRYIQLFFDDYDETNVDFTIIKEKDVLLN